MIEILLACNQAGCHKAQWAGKWPCAHTQLLAPGPAGLWRTSAAKVSWLTDSRPVSFCITATGTRTVRCALMPAPGPHAGMLSPQAKHPCLLLLVLALGAREAHTTPGPRPLACPAAIPVLHTLQCICCDTWQLGVLHHKKRLHCRPLLRHLPHNVVANEQNRALGIAVRPLVPDLLRWRPTGVAGEPAGAGSVAAPTRTAARILVQAAPLPSFLKL